MNLELLRIEEKGNLEKERVVLRVKKDDSTNNYVIMDATFDEEGDISNIGRHAYKFWSKDVKTGDFVVLYTRKKNANTPNETERVSGKPVTHFFYWGRQATIWNIEKDYCRLLYIIDSKIV
jgi:hypothetical protein